MLCFIFLTQLLIKVCGLEHQECVTRYGMSATANNLCSLFDNPVALWDIIIIMYIRMGHLVTPHFLCFRFADDCELYQVYFEPCNLKRGYRHYRHPKNIYAITFVTAGISNISSIVNGLSIGSGSI